MVEKDSHNGKEQSFDWDSIQRRIAELSVAMEEAEEISPEELQRIWERRAVELARVPVEEDESEHIRLVLMRLGREIYGIEAHHVFAIRPAGRITYVPRVPEWVAGVVNMRGRILSVIDLRRFFGLPLVEPERDDGSESIEEMYHLVVVETPGMEVALLVSDVLTVEALPIGRMQDAVGTVRGLRAEYVRGVVTDLGQDTTTGESGSMVVVLDLPALLADERLVVHEEVV